MEIGASKGAHLPPLSPVQGRTQAGSCGRAQRLKGHSGGTAGSSALQHYGRLLAGITLAARRMALHPAWQLEVSNRTVRQTALVAMQRTRGNWASTSRT